MPLIRPYVMRGARLHPFDGGAPVTPPEPPGPGGDPGGGDPGGDPGGGGPGGTGTGLLIGATPDPAHSYSVFAADEAEMGPWTCHRGFDTGLPSTWASTACSWDVGRWASVWSGKPDPAQVASGALDTAIHNFINSIPDSHTAFVTIWHEADVKLKKGSPSYTDTQYKAAWRRFFSIVREINKPHVYTTQIFGNYVFIKPSPSKGATMENLWPGVDGTGKPLVDVIAFDGYSFTAAETGTYMWGPGRQFADSKGVAWGIAECGLADTVTNGSQAATWMQAMADYSATNGAGPHGCAPYLCWFNTPVGGVLKTPEYFSQTRTKSAQISQQYYTPYTTFSM